MLFVVRPIVHHVYNKVRATSVPPSKHEGFLAFLFMSLLVSAFASEVIGPYCPFSSTNLCQWDVQPWSHTIAHSDRLGIHAFFGAFVAGMIVPKEHGLHHDLEPKIDLLVRTCTRRDIHAIHTP
jgi:Kef-type K+ transport system membrane component KefB